MNQFSTLVNLLRYRALQQPKQTAFIFLQDGEAEIARLTYEDLDKLSRVIATRLQSLTVPGDRALLLYPPGLEFISAFFGCLYAGVLAIPAYPPRPNRSMERLNSIIADAQAKVALTTTSILVELERRLAEVPNIALRKWLSTDEINDDWASLWKEPAVDSDSLAFLQYTSGSTGTPKGVMVSHGNLLHNSEYIKQAFELTADSVSVTWLPSFHDMGLIDGILQPIYTGFLGVLIPPVSFLQKSIRWLEAISRYKATHSGGPNFGYDLCVSKITPEQRQSLDLSSWRSAYNGAEPVRRATLDLFAATFEPCGFRASFFYPCYGMAEATLIVSGGLVKDEPTYCAVQADALEQNRVVEASENTQSVRHLVGCGRSWLDIKIIIVNPESLTQCDSNQVGEIWVSGSSVAQGYWNRPEETQRTFNAYLADTGEGPYLRTGDLGFLQNGELFLTGRLKDVIIIRGRNHYPQDIEWTVEHSHPSLRPSCSAAFSVDVAGVECLVVVAELERRYMPRRHSLTSHQIETEPSSSNHTYQPLDIEVVATHIRQAVAEHHELQVCAVLLLKTGSIPKTSSGKIQRHACRVGFLAKTLEVVGEWIEKPEDRALHTSYSGKDNLNEQDVAAQLSSQGLSQSREAIQAWLVSQISRQLKVNSQTIDIQKPLTSYGLDSVKAVSIVAELENELKRRLSPTLLYDYSSIDELSRCLVEESDVGNSTDTLYTGNVNIYAEAYLEPTICSDISFVETVAEPASIFLTGATGFLGAFLLKEFLEQTLANVYCLVRASNADLGKKRIQKNLESYGLWHENFSARIITVVGDLSQPQLGLSRKEFQRMASEIDIIYHSAAWLNFIYPYSALKSTNVLGTQEVLRLASQIKIKPVHYVSTVAVFESAAYAEKIVTESDQPTRIEGMHLGYSQSKWIAEGLVMTARDRGLPVCIYRSPLISGHSQTGAWYTDDFICRLIKGCIQMGSTPNLDYVFDMSPVDYVSRAIVYLSRQRQASGQTFHLMNPHSLHWSQFFDWINSFGYPIQNIPYEKWQAQLSNTVHSAGNSLYPLLPFFLKRWSEEQLTIPELYQKDRKPLFAYQKTLDALAGSDIVCPPIDNELLKTYFSYLIRVGFLQKC